MLGGLNPEYVLDRMQMYEVETLLEGILNRQSWELTRFIAYMIAQTNSRKQLKVTDIMKFDWDNESKKEAVTTISNEDVQRLKEKAKLFANGFNNKTST